MPAVRALNLKKASVFKLVVVITALLSWVIALGAASASMLQNLYAGWHLGRTNSITLYLPPDAEPAAVQQLQQSLPTLEGVETVTPVETAKLQEWLKPVIANPETLPLPTVMEVALNTGADRPSLIAHIQQSFPTAEVDDHLPLLTQVEGAVRSLQASALALAGVMLALMALLVMLTVRTGLSAQRGTLHLLITLGATDASLCKLVTHQVSLRVISGAAIGTLCAGVVLLGATLAYPGLAAHVAANTWAALVLAPLLLPILAALTAHTATARMLKQLA